MRRRIDSKGAKPADIDLSRLLAEITIRQNRGTWNQYKVSGALPSQGHHVYPYKARSPVQRTLRGTRLCLSWARLPSGRGWVSIYSWRLILPLKSSPSFWDYSTIFNGNVVTASKAVVCPLDAEDVSRCAPFCFRNTNNDLFYSGSCYFAQSTTFHLPLRLGDMERQDGPLGETSSSTSASSSKSTLSPQKRTEPSQASAT